MRFLNLKFSIPGKKVDLDLSLKPGENTIQTGDEFLAGVLPHLPVIAVYGRSLGKETPADLLDSDRHSITLEAGDSGKDHSFIYENGGLNNDPAVTAGLISFDDFLLYSCFIPGVNAGEPDPVLRNGAVKNFLVRMDAGAGNTGNLHSMTDVITQKGKEISGFRKEKEILELKKRKKEKLGKEVSGSEKELGKLRRKRESCTAYRNTLTEIIDLMQEETKISSKTVNLKKDIIEIRENSVKRESLEQEIAQRFPQFTSGMIELIPDLDRLQGEFNSIRDINEEMEKFDSDRKRRISLSLKGLTAGLVFAFLSIVFMLLKPVSPASAAGILLGTLASILVLLSAATGYYVYLLIRENYPEELVTGKKEIESGLLKVFTNENFPHRNFGTGELYEYLFQYFEDFLTFRDLQNELSHLKKGFNSRASLQEREEKLNELTAKKEEIERTIEERLRSLDENIHITPDREGIKDLIPELDEMIAEIVQEEKQKGALVKKIESEALQYESGDKSEKIIDEQIKGIDSEIEKLKKEIDQITFMQKVYDETADEWFSAKLPDLAGKCAEFYCRMHNENDIAVETADSVKELFLSGNGEFSAEELSLVAISMKLALYEFLSGTPDYPLILADPFKFFKQETADKLKKILLELSEKRQVVIFTSKSEADLAGNLINI